MLTAFIVIVTIVLLFTTAKHKADATRKRIDELDEWFDQLDEDILRELFPEISDRYPESERFLDACDECFSSLEPKEKFRILNSTRHK